jgi:hypothetical protein
MDNKDIIEYLSLVEKMVLNRSCLTDIEELEMDIQTNRNPRIMNTETVINQLMLITEKLIDFNTNIDDFKIYLDTQLASNFEQTIQTKVDGKNNTIVNKTQANYEYLDKTKQECLLFIQTEFDKTDKANEGRFLFLNNPTRLRAKFKEGLLVLFSRDIDEINDSISDIDLDYKDIEQNTRINDILKKYNNKFIMYNNVISIYNFNIDNEIYNTTQLARMKLLTFNDATTNINKQLLEKTNAINNQEVDYLNTLPRIFIDLLQKVIDKRDEFMNISNVYKNNMKNSINIINNTVVDINTEIDNIDNIIIDPNNNTNNDAIRNSNNIILASAIRINELTYACHNEMYRFDNEYNKVLSMIYYFKYYTQFIVKCIEHINSIYDSHFITNSKVEIDNYIHYRDNYYNELFNGYNDPRNLSSKQTFYKFFFNEPIKTINKRGKVLSKIVLNKYYGDNINKYTNTLNNIYIRMDNKFTIVSNILYEYTSDRLNSLLNEIIELPHNDELEEMKQLIQSIESSRDENEIESSRDEPLFSIPRITDLNFHLNALKNSSVMSYIWNEIGNYLNTANINDHYIKIIYTIYKYLSSYDNVCGTFTYSKVSDYDKQLYNYIVGRIKPFCAIYLYDCITNKRDKEEISEFFNGLTKAFTQHNPENKTINPLIDIYCSIYNINYIYYEDYNDIDKITGGKISQFRVILFILIIISILSLIIAIINYDIELPIISSLTFQ